MNSEALELQFSRKVGAKIRLAQEGVGRYRVFAPFQFGDGDHLSIVLQRENSEWLLTDEGHTFMHLTYDIDERGLLEGTREKLIATAVLANQIEDRDGELVLRIPSEQYGDALFSFIQALIRISDVSYLSRERVESTFREDFKALVAETIPQTRHAFDWHHPTNDPEGKYPVDCYVNGMKRPLVVYALTSDSQTRDATISLLQFEKWSVPLRSLAIFEDQEAIGRRVLSRFSDVCEKQYSSLVTNKARIQRYLQDAIQESSI